MARATAHVFRLEPALDPPTHEDWLTPAEVQSGQGASRDEVNTDCTVQLTADKENIMSSIWRSILTFIAIFVAIVVLGMIFFAAH